jgi:hypothetical protein
MRMFKFISGIILALLGLLWALQGADLIHIEPILCFANCEPLVGGSVTWLIVGLVVMASGAWLLVSSRRTQPPGKPR